MENQAVFRILSDCHTISRQFRFLLCPLRCHNRYWAELTGERSQVPWGSGRHPDKFGLHFFSAGLYGLNRSAEYILDMAGFLA